MLVGSVTVVVGKTPFHIVCQHNRDKIAYVEVMENLSVCYRDVYQVVFLVLHPHVFEV